MSPSDARTERIVVPTYCPWCGALLDGRAVCPSCEREAHDARLGRVLGDKYRIEALIGEGGMGRVYRATHLSLGEPVVVKFLLAEWASRAELRARFRREAVVLARLRHPGIVAVHDFGEDEGSPYLVMELVDGVTLASLIDGEHAMPLARVGAVFEQILQVLQASHASGVVHRDMKPENVMLLDAGDGVDRVKVLDFGVAFIDDAEGGERLTQVGTVQGTPLYMSPEQCHGRDVGPPTDIYAVGAMLYEVLAGEPPFSGASTPELLAKQIYSNPPPMDERGRMQPVPPGVETVVRRALAKLAASRPTAEDLRSLLAGAIAGTDAVSRGHRAADERSRAAVQVRDARVLARVAPSQAATHSGPVVGATLTVDAPRVLIWQLARARAERLRDALAVDGMEASLVRTGAELTDIDVALAKAIVLAAGPTAASSVAALRASAAFSRLPVLVVDAGEEEDLPALIRAGASDVALAGSADGLVCRQLWRLIRRGR